jgi:hypothetical protein
VGVKTGSSVTRRGMGDLGLDVLVVVVVDLSSRCCSALRAVGAAGSARMSRCLSSRSSSESEASPSSKVSASVWSSSLLRGSWWERRRPKVGDEASDRKDGGGEEGVDCGVLCVIEVEWSGS